MNSFSIPHDVAYSIEAVQEANLATRFNPLFWQCACLSVNAGSSVTQMERAFGEEASDDEEFSSCKNITPDYGKIAKAITQARNNGARIELPDINLAEGDFVPDVANNSILFSLQSVSGVNADLVSTIISNRPYTSVENFVEKVRPSKQQMFALLKAGCFDNLYPGKTRGYVTAIYLNIVAKESISRKTKLTMSNLPMAEKLGIVPLECAISVRAFKYKKWEDANELVKEEKRYKIENPGAVRFFEDYCLPRLNATDYYTLGAAYSVSKSALQKAVDILMEPLKQWLSNPSTLDVMYKAELEGFVQENLSKYFAGTESKWEMQTLHFYHGAHELHNVNQAKYDIINFDNLEETPSPIDYTVGHDGTQRPVYAVHNICGTVVSSDNNKHIVSLLTNFNTVVDVKFTSFAYNAYNKALGRGDDIPESDKSWFERGTLLLISGYRRENSFVPRAAYASGQKSAVRLITGIDRSGTLSLVGQKKGV